MLRQCNDQDVDPYLAAEEYIRQVHKLDAWPVDGSCRRKHQFVSPLIDTQEEARTLMKTMHKRDPANKAAIEHVAARNANNGKFRVCITLSLIQLPRERMSIDRKLMANLAEFLNEHHAPFGKKAWRVNDNLGVVYESPSILFCFDGGKYTMEHALEVVEHLQNDFEQSMKDVEISPALVRAFKENLFSYDSKSSGHLHHLKTPYLYRLALATVGLQQDEVEAKSIFSSNRSSPEMKKSKVAPTL